MANLDGQIAQVAQL